MKASASSFKAGCIKRNFFKTGADVIFVLGNVDTKDFSVKATHTIKENKLANVVGVLPGKKLKEEYVIFRAITTILASANLKTATAFTTVPMMMPPVLLP